MAGWRRSDPATIDYISLIGDGRAVVGRQEQDQACHIFRQQASLKRLARQDFSLVFWRQPQPALALSQDGAGQYAVHADVFAA